MLVAAPRVVLERRLQHAVLPARHQQRLVHLVLAVAHPLAQEQLGLRRCVAAVLQRAAEEVGLPRHLEHGEVAPRLVEHVVDLVAQFGRHHLVGIDRQHPLAAAVVERTVALRAVPRPIGDPELVGVAAHDVGRAVGAAAVEHDDLARPAGHRLQAGLDPVGLVADDHHDRDGRAAAGTGQHGRGGVASARMIGARAAAAGRMQRPRTTRATLRAMTLPSSLAPGLRPSRVLQLPVRGLHYQVHAWGDASLVAPDRPPLMLLHGWMDVGASFQFLVDALATPRFVLAPDWRGFGGSLVPPATDSYWFADYLADLDALLDQFAPDQPVDLLGHSMGGNVVMLYAGVRPARICRLINLEGFGMPRCAPAQAPGRYAKWLDELKAPQRLRDYASLDEVAH
eukprot:Opistho-2@27625